MHRYILCSIPNHSSLSILQHYPIARTHWLFNVYVIIVILFVVLWSFFSFFSILLSHRSKSLFIHFSCDPSFYCSLYSDHVRVNLFILIGRHQYHLFTIQCSRNHSVFIFPHRIKHMC